MVHALGVCGVEGGLREGLEMTFGVMRSAKLLLATVIGVLRHDPLQQWGLTPQQMAQLQLESDDIPPTLPSGSSASNGSQNVDPCGSGLADRCLRKVEEKISGVEDNTALTVPEQVTSLIHQATDLSNLCVLFQGWKPWV